jgi:replicative DNA helicase
MAKENNNKSYNKKEIISHDIDGLGKLPPQAIALEEAVLGALMLEKDALTDVVDILKSDSFYLAKHQIIYQAIITLFTKSEPIDVLTVANELKRTGELEKGGGVAYIADLTGKVNSASNIEYHARIVSEMSIKREMISISSEMQKEAFEETTDVFELLDKTEQALFKVADGNVKKSFADMQSVLRGTINTIEERSKKQDELTGVPSGMIALDRVTNGWQSSDLIIIAARPAMGKTAFVLTCLRNAAVDFNRPVAIFSLEMSAEQLMTRMLSAEAEIEAEKLQKGSLEKHEWTQLHQKIDRLAEAKLFIDDTPGLSILELRAKCRRLKQQHDIQMIVIDYLQLMSGDSNAKKSGNREQEIASISRALKHIAKELNVPVIALSQLSRAVETRGGDKRPQLSDLRESGSIEQDADQVMFLYRAEYYGIEQTEDGTPTAGVGEIIISKNRHGSLGNVPLRFIGKYTKFCDLDSGINTYSEPTTPTNNEPITTEETSFRSKLNDVLGANQLVEKGEDAPF